MGNLECSHRNNNNASPDSAIILGQCGCEEGDVSKTGVANFQTSQRWNTEARQVGNKEAEAIGRTHTLPQIQGSQTEPPKLYMKPETQMFYTESLNLNSTR